MFEISFYLILSYMHMFIIYALTVHLLFDVYYVDDIPDTIRKAITPTFVKSL